MCLRLVRKLAEGSEECDVQRVLGNRAGSLNIAANPGGTWDGEDGVGVVVWTNLDLGPTAVHLARPQFKFSSPTSTFMASMRFLNHSHSADVWGGHIRGRLVERTCCGNIFVLSFCIGYRRSGPTPVYIMRKSTVVANQQQLDNERNKDETHHPHCR